MRILKSIAFAALLGFGSTLSVSRAEAQTQAPASPADGVAQEAIGQIRSPYCPGLMLEVCPSPQAEMLRDSIKAAAAAGQSAEGIVEDVIARHGEQWRAVPKRSGAGLWAWIAPPAMLLLGMGFVFGRLRSMRKGAAQADAGGSAQISDEERARLAAALREFDRAEGAGT